LRTTVLDDELNRGQFQQHVNTRAAFKHTYPKSAKRQSSHQCLFAVLGSVFEKATNKTLVKSTPGVVTIGEPPPGTKM